MEERERGGNEYGCRENKRGNSGAGREGGMKLDGIREIAVYNKS